MKKHAVMLASLLGLALTIVALPTRAAADDDDPPSRVARLSLAQGAVSFEPAGTEDWVAAVVNRPMTTGDKLWSDNNARAEMHIGSASLRIGGNTGFSFLNLTDNVTQIQLTDGTLRVRVKHLDENETFEIDTPNLAFSVLRPGVYRITVNQDSQATIIRVGGGEGEVTAPGVAYNIHANEIGNFSGGDQLQADIEPFNGDDDDFDRWCFDRDRHEDLSVSARYVSPDVIGYQDLDDYGGWRPVPEYGEVWFPHTTVVGWAPYRFGHWVYIWPWGYTWVDDAPWGFAPFHYGRWVFVNGYWGWVPCPPPAPRVVYVRPVYAPALVAWIGGPHVGVGIGVGWFPLGPREVFVPSYHVSRTYITNVNISNTTVNTTVINNYYNTTVINHQVTNIRYVNQGVAGGVTVTSRETFTSAQPVGRHFEHIDNREVARAEVNVNAPAIAPDRRAFLGTGQQVAMKPPQQAWTRPVIAKVTPPPAPVAYNRQIDAIKANGGQPVAIHEMQQIQPQGVTVRANVRVAAPTTPREIDRGRFGQQQNNATTGNAQGQPGFKGGYRTSGSNNSLQNGQGVQPAGNNNNNAGQFNAGNNSNNSGGGRQRTYDDRPPSSRPNGYGNNSVNTANTMHSNPQLDQHQAQQMEQLHTRQDQERQKVEQQQWQQRQKVTQSNTDDSHVQQMNQRHQQQLQTLETKHDNQTRQLEQKQQQERSKDNNKSSSGHDDHKDKGK